MQPTAEYLLGFDARVLPAPWSASHRAQYLLRDDVTCALTASIGAWPSIFAKGESRPDWIGVFDPLWEDLDELRAALALLPAGLPHLSIAVTVHTAEAAGLECYFENGCGVSNANGEPPHPDPCRPPVRDPRWRFLGYDLIDSFGVSGLSNCGYDPEERTALAPVWSPRLNDQHLFDEFSRADAFREITDRRVTEHAPFYVHGLWLIERVG